MEMVGHVIADISALSSLINAYYSAKSNNSKISKSVIRKAKARALEPLKVGGKVINQIIAPELLNTISLKIEKRVILLSDALSDTSMRLHEHEQIVKDAELEICSFLKLVNRFNNDKLPTKKLKDYWQSFNCNY